MALSQNLPSASTTCMLPSHYAPPHSTYPTPTRSTHALIRLWMYTESSGIQLHGRWKAFYGVYSARKPLYNPTGTFLFIISITKPSCTKIIINTVVKKQSHRLMEDILCFKELPLIQRFKWKKRGERKRSTFVLPLCMSFLLTHTPSAASLCPLLYICLMTAPPTETKLVLQQHLKLNLPLL